MNTLHYKTTYALLPLILILTVLITPSCGRNRAYEARVKELLLSAERDNFLADVHGGDSIFQSFDTIGPHTTNAHTTSGFCCATGSSRSTTLTATR
ncbi:MAG: hypothetical protein IAC51_05590 [bacterium]|uniref:Uncharacterized protein n=1 Tax=Candidatus Aphodosoma intestinipullorum TaxID=2840674 RepID=A0A940DLF5_9BACT|nr:hypothetical protein [Candidatus Aphodosoma intestinipullorum]